jgi:hypothetical protein
LVKYNTIGFNNIVKICLSAYPGSYKLGSAPLLVNAYKSVNAPPGWCADNSLVDISTLNYLPQTAEVNKFIIDIKKNLIYPIAINSSRDFICEELP